MEETFDERADRADDGRRDAPKRASLRLVAGDGANATVLMIMARRISGNRGQTVVTTIDANKKSTRGMTTRHDTFELAVAALHRLAADAAKKGWQRRERSGFKPRPDSFAVLPAPPKASK